MTLTLTIELPTEVEAELRASVFRGDEERVRELLVDAVTPRVKALLQEVSEPLTMEEREALLDELAAMVPPDVPPLSDYAVSREGIYEDHL